MEEQRKNPPPCVNGESINTLNAVSDLLSEITMRQDKADTIIQHLLSTYNLLSNKGVLDRWKWERNTILSFLEILGDYIFQIGENAENLNQFITSELAEARGGEDGKSGD